MPHHKVEDISELVLARYPSHFVQEVRRKAGALFFASRRERIRHVVSSSMSNMNALSMHGSILPFYYGAYIGRFYAEDYQDRPSIATWSLHRDGSVDVKEAVILIAADRAN